MKPTISIITVCYFSEATIESTILSVLSQDYPQIEYIIIDGGSTDKTLEIISKYKGNISKLISEPDKGIYDAMNKGIAMATGDIIGILNSDDIFFTNSVISDVVSVFTSDKNVDAVYGNIAYFTGGDKGKTVRTWITKPYYDTFFDDGEVPPHPSLFVKKSVYDAIGTYFPGFKISSDYEFMFRAFKVNGYQSYHLNKFVVNMRMGGESTKSLKNILIGNKEVKMAWAMNNKKPNLRFWILRVFKKLLQFAKK
ncbi:MAG TPA: glycosyltransferase family 2 protein [Mucilaginibacter sp.]|nr:glycosyltransferase family 2 protein [Mucilaginibacter sp.]